MARIQSADVCKLLAILAVITIHSVPFGFSVQPDSGLFHPAVFTNQLSRFAVPLFFVLSGYFLGRKVRNGDNASRVLISAIKKISLVFIFWSLVYLLPHNLTLIARDGWAQTSGLAFDHAVSLFSKPLTTLFEGSAGHLWFLSSLLSCIVFSAVFIVKNKLHALLALAAALYVFGLITKAYANTPWGLQIEFNTRNGPFFGLLLFSSGLLLSHKTPSAGWFSKGLIVLAAGYVLHFSEVYVLNKYHGASLFQDYVLGTCLLGLGFAMVALSNHPWIRLDGLGGLARAGRLALGIYGVHVLVIENLYPVKGWVHAYSWDIGFVLCVFILSFAAAWLMSRYSALRKWVL